jgi:hypothetical protein
MTIYRKIYEQHFDEIPKDSEGRTYDIHHIDGNRNNNDISNLKCVSIQDHYDIHLSQGDYGACYMIAQRMNRSLEEISALAREAGLKLIREGRHNWQGDGTLQRRLAKQRIANNNHHFIGESNPSIKKVKEGSHLWLNTELQRENQLKKVRDGTHHLLTGDIQKSMWSDPNGVHKIKMQEGTHHLTTNHQCPHCNKVGKGPLMFRWHFDNCRYRHSHN